MTAVCVGRINAFGRKIVKFLEICIPRTRVNLIIYLKVRVLT